MRVPRDVDADTLIKLLEKYGYNAVRQTGSHIRMKKETDDGYNPFLRTTLKIKGVGIMLLERITDNELLGVNRAVNNNYAC